MPFIRAGIETPEHAMKTASKPRSILTQTACMLLLMTALTSCELPPREAWGIIQRDGLLTYWSRNYQPSVLPSRYVAPNGGPLVTSRRSQVPYRPGTLQQRAAGNRYMASGAGSPSSKARVPYRPRPQTQQRVQPRNRAPEAEIARKQESKILMEPSKNTAPAPARTPASPAANTAASTPEAPKPTAPVEPLPYGTPVAGRPGMVTSPFAEKQQLVDVTGMAPGEAVKDPYSGKLFRVPPTQQAAAEKTEGSPPPAPSTPAEDAKPKP